MPDEEKWLKWAQKQSWPVLCDKCEILKKHKIDNKLLWSQHFMFHQPMPDSDTHESADDELDDILHYWFTDALKALRDSETDNRHKQGKQQIEAYASQSTLQTLRALREQRVVYTKEVEYGFYPAIPLSVIDAEISKLEGKQ